MSSVLLEVHQGVAVITLNRPKVRNALNLEAMDALGVAVDACAVPGVSCVILTGAGDEAFCAGGDLKALQQLTSEEDGRSMSLRMQRVLHRLSSLPVPVVGVLNGYAMGGGSETWLATDIRIAEEHGSLSWRQLFFGVGLGWGAAGRLAREMGPRRAFKMVALQETLTAQQAKDVGLVDEVVPKGQGMARAREIAAQLSAMAPLGLATLKRQLMDVPSPMQREADLFAPSWGSQDHHEAVAAFFQKRPPAFQGK